MIGDGVRLRQVLINLLTNAIKFTPEGSVTLFVTRHTGESDDRHAVVEFQVRDTGIGISPEKQEMIFRAFEQEDTTTTRKFGGTGLGLTIASNLVRAMGGGDIKLESSPGLGSTFSFTVDLPLEPANPGIAARPGPNEGLEIKRPDTIRQEPGLAAGRLRVLVAEDNPFNGQLMLRLLEKRGHSVFIAENGELALEAATSRSFDLLLLDLHMPLLDGLDVIHSLRAREAAEPGRKRLPVIALTARSIAGIREECLAAGMDDVLQKPMPPDELFHAIEELLARQPAVSLRKESSLIDFEMLLSVCGGDETVMEGLKSVFLENLPKQLRELEKIDKEGALPALRESAHKIAGMLRAFSRECGDLALLIEEAAIAGDRPTCRREVERLVKDASRLMHEVESLTFQSLQDAAPLMAS